MKHIVKYISVNLNEFDDDDVIEYVACDLGCKVVKPGEDDGEDKERDYTLWPMDDRDELKKHLIHILGISTSSTSGAIIEKVKSILK